MSPCNVCSVAITATDTKIVLYTLSQHIFFSLFLQWFGNLVTLRWWNDLWLNEGFASYVEYLGADNAEPDWNVVRISFAKQAPRKV